MGYLKVTFGPMFSRKTSDLYSEVEKLIDTTDEKILIINSSIDNRPDLNNVGEISTHSRIISKINSHKINIVKRETLWINVDENYIFIDEAQFFPDLFLFVKENLSKDKNIFVYGLINDYKMENFGQIKDILCMADKIVQKYAVCTYCKGIDRPAPFTAAKIRLEEQIECGSSSFEPTCRKHHYILGNE